MAQKLSNSEPVREGSSHLDRRTATFKIALEDYMHGNFNFSKMDSSGRKNLQTFLDKTVYKQLSISTVDKLFLRMKGTVREKAEINGIDRDIVHYGFDRSPFRLHGYFNELNYFVIYKIDPKHKVHKAK